MTRERIQVAIDEAERLFDTHVRVSGAADEDIEAAELVCDALREMLEEHNERD